jgi:hypothetical protein
MQGIVNHDEAMSPDGSYDGPPDGPYDSFLREAARITDGVPSAVAAPREPRSSDPGSRSS